MGAGWPSGNVSASAGRFQARNPTPLKIRCVWGLLDAKSYIVDKAFPTGVSSARPSPRVRSPTENHEPAQDFQRGSSSPAPYMRADGLPKIGVYCT
ncbi:hypothetical protein AVEN_238066-1 [Araneus ventricosus]|uniref:Uncharacterized protein n=1 Tax=Araneus ventricosus TaxID=182803 RepID=A0A4Y2HZF9_ARAVE|nr:hypothetical protein AVEN_238066-1 [Araneus ventricosus]